MAGKSPASQRLSHQEDLMKPVHGRKMTRTKPKPIRGTSADDQAKVNELRVEMLRFGTETLGLTHLAAKRRADIIAEVYSAPPKR